MVDTPVETLSELECDTSISRRRKIAEVPVPVPHYATCHSSMIVTGKETGEFLYQLGVGQLSFPSSIATHGDVSMSAAGLVTLLELF